MHAKMIACCSRSKIKTWMLVRYAMSLNGNLVRFLCWKMKEKSIYKSYKAFSIDSKAPKALCDRDHRKGHKVACRGAS